MTIIVDVTSSSSTGSKQTSSLNYYVDSVGARKAGMESLILNRFGRLGVEEIRDQAILSDITEVAGWMEARQPRT